MPDGDAAIASQMETGSLSPTDRILGTTTSYASRKIRERLLSTRARM